MAKKIKKAQKGTKMKVSKDSVPSEMFPGKMIPRSSSTYESGFNIATGKYDTAKKSTTPKKSIAPVKKVAVAKKTMKKGGALKPVDSSKNPGLAKLPTAVRNKMGYQKMGGKVGKKKK